jgi:predicted glycosyltransferase
MLVWIDLDNSPHAHFFAPLIACLERRGIDVTVTTRSFGQTEELARFHGMQFVTIGRHRTPVHRVTRVLATLQRAYQLASYVRRLRPTVAISHGSRASMMAAWALRIPILALHDYEYASHRFFYRIVNEVMLPSEIPTERLLCEGLTPAKVVRYPGLKEEVYIYDFRPDPSVLSQLGLDPDRVIITVRPPATWAHYHSPLSDRLLKALVERLRSEPAAQVVMLTRTPEQAQTLRVQYRIDGKPFRLPASAVDALSLMWYSDAVFSGGGTMVREAALLGVKTYSIFGGKLGAADQALIRDGKLTAIRDPEHLASLPLRKHTGPRQSPLQTSQTRDFIVNEIVRFVTAAGSGQLQPNSGKKGAAIAAPIAPGGASAQKALSTELLVEPTTSGPK